MRKLNVTDGRTDRRGVLQYLPSRAFGAVGDKKHTHGDIIMEQPHTNFYFFICPVPDEKQKCETKVFYKSKIPLTEIDSWENIFHPAFPISGLKKTKDTRNIAKKCV